MKRTLTAALTMLSALAIASPAYAFAGGGTSEEIDGTRRIVGAGTWGPAVGSGTLTVPFECQATATPDAISTSIKPAEDGGCVLKRNGVIVERADGRTVPGPEAVTAGVAEVPLLNTESIEVCWDVHASFSDGKLLQTSDCSDITIP